MTAVTNEHDMATPEGQLARARERGLTIVRIMPTGEAGWLIQGGVRSQAAGYRVRIAGARGYDAVRMVAERDVEVVPA
ncbi:hypothetical protein ABZ605_38025 [Streptomyces sp. NPDC012765]|uniref:hypothetical protein n=1 Tax=Streptomyces sp. NPDC012765 TaxID=3155249 RepID=UPI0033EA1E5F